MTEAELYALRDVTPTFDTVERIIDGKTVLVPKMRDEVGALYDPMTVIDSVGQMWLVGYHRGELVRRKVPGWRLCT